MSKKESKSITRRKFIAGTSAAAISLSVMKPQIVFGSHANSKIRLGLIGCGERGTWLADFCVENGNYDIVAAADYFSERVDTFGDKFKIEKGKRFTGLSCYKKLLETDVDAVMIESPPYFHPEQAEAAVAAGKHVFLAKPIGIDVPGCKSVEESGKIASSKNLCFLIDFQTRADKLFIEAIRRVHEGAIGKLAFGEGIYHAEYPFYLQQPFLEADPTNPENRLKAWGISRELSGDIITEQNIHVLDVMSWIMNQKPLFAVGTGGHTVRNDPGNCWDHFALLYQYPENVGVTFSSRQFEGYDSNFEGLRNRMFGSDGVIEAQYVGEIIIKGKNPYPGGKSLGIYSEGAITNIEAFHKNITEGNYENPTVEPSVTSNLVSILGRTAAYEGSTCYWHQLMNDEQRLIPDLEGLEE